MAKTMYRPLAAVDEVAAAQLAAALAICVRDYRRAALDCPLAAGIVARRRRRQRRDAVPRGPRRLLDEASRADGIYLAAAAACRRAGGPPGCPLRSAPRIRTMMRAAD